MRLLLMTALELVPGDGRALHVRGLAAALERLGHEVRLAGPRDLALVRRAAYDALYCRAHPTLLPVTTLARLCGRPMLVEVNGPLLEERRQLGASGGRRALLAASEAALLHLAARVVAVTDQLAALLVRRYRLAPGRVAVVPNGVDTERYAPAADRAGLRRVLGVAPDEPLIGFVGSLQPWRRLEESLQAMALLLRRLPTARMVIVGAGPEHERLRASAERLGLLGPRATPGAPLRLTGQLPEAQALDWTRALDLGLSFDHLPYDFGAGALKLRSYAACGVWQLASAGTSAGQWVECHGLGQVVDAGAPAAIAAAMHDCLGDRERLARLGGAARAYAVRHLDWRQTALAVEAAVTGLR